MFIRNLVASSRKAFQDGLCASGSHAIFAVTFASVATFVIFDAIAVIAVIFAPFIPFAIVPVFALLVIVISANDSYSWKDKSYLFTAPCNSHFNHDRLSFFPLTDIVSTIDKFVVEVLQSSQLIEYFIPIIGDYVLFIFCNDFLTSLFWMSTYLVKIRIDNLS